MSASDLTLMAVHAHPDDEASSTGGILAKYSSEGVQTVLVTCTNGELGDGPGGEKPDEPTHNEKVVVETRRKELAKSCEILGIHHLEMLGYHDSGMMGWEQNEMPGAFWNASVDEAAKPLIALIEKYRPQILVTYDENGFYGHPDHIQANRITLAAAEATGIAAKVYYPAFPKSKFGAMGEVFDQAGIERPFDPEAEGIGTDDEMIGAVIDCRDFVQNKYDALAAHRSQTENAFFTKLSLDHFSQIFGYESFIRHFDTTNALVIEDDLFAGLR